MPVVLVGDEIGINAAALLIRSGKTVVIPTETVYGLAANALDYNAVSEIFRIKRRPATNPIIVHVCSVEQAESVAHVDERMRRLADAFWPGPLTIVMKAHDCVPANVSAGGDTVGVRMPNHLLALELIKQCGVPLAAPSANRSESLSPTTVADVYRSLGELTPPILDGGPCLVGIESTVVDISGDVAAVLRPGAISRAQIAAVLGEEVMVGGQHTVARSPGQMIRHYAPATPAVLTALPEIEAMVHGRTALLCYSSSPIHTRAFCSVGRLPGEPEGYANGLYAILHELDRVGADLIIIETPPDTEEWTAIRDRLTRATAPIKSP